jgi:prevent-host-death family protein
MEKTIELAELTPQLQSVMAEVVAGHRPCLITESGQPKAVMIEYSEYLKLQPTQAQPRVAETTTEYVVESTQPQAEEKNKPWRLPWPREDEDWFHEHIDEIAKRFSRKWVAVRDETVVAWYSNAEKRWIMLDLTSEINPEKCFHGFVGWKDRN